MRKNISRLLLLFSLSLITVSAYSAPYLRKNKQNDTLIVKAYTDSLLAVSNRLYAPEVVCEKDCGVGAKFYLFSPTTFYHSVFSNVLGNGLENGETTERENQMSDACDGIDGVMMNIYLNHPELVVKSERRVNRAGKVHNDFVEPIRNKSSLVEDVGHLPDYVDNIDVPLEIVVKKPNFWKVSGDYYLQILQNYVSSNWYKGGESNYSMVGSVTLQANYNNKQKVKFDNKLEMKLGFQTTRGDSLHSVKTSEDLIRYTGKLGLQATKRWYYSLQLIAYTQFMKGFKSNDYNVYSDIFSPLNVNLSVGMDYSVEWFNKKLTGTMHFAPLAYNFKYVGREDLATRYGLKEGKHTLNDFGSECTIDLTWTLSNMVKWKTRLYGYTTYKRAELEWENTLTLQFNRYIASNIFVYPRFDDGAVRDEKHGYWQLKEYASIGFAYSF